MKYSKELHEKLRVGYAGITYVQCLLDEIDRLQAERRWIPVSERLPESGVNIITCDIRGYVGLFTLGYEKDYWLNTAGWRFAFDSITHWMPLPEPPDES